MRKRSMSVFVPKDSNSFSKRFEGITSDNDVRSDSENEEDTHKTENEDEVISEGWTKPDYDLLVEKMRAALPKKDVKKYKSQLQALNWDEIEVRHHSPEEIRRMAESLIAKVRSFRTLTDVLNDVPAVVAKILDGDKPKAPLSAYNLYTRENMTRWKEENPDMKATDLFRIASKSFHELSAKKRKKYDDMAARNKAEYQTVLAKYYEDHPDRAPAPKVRAPRGTGKTRLRQERKRNPFNLFYESRLEVSSNITMQQARREWEELPIKKKLTFIRQSFEVDDGGKLLNKKEQEMLDRYHGKPDYVGRNAFDYFKRQQRHKYDGTALSGTERELKLCEDYKNLSERQALDLKYEYLAAKEKYVEQYQAFIKNLPEDKRKTEIEYLQGLIGKKERGAGKKAAASKEEELYPGSADEDPPAAESTTIKKPSKEKKSKKAAAAAVPSVVREEEDDDDDDEDITPAQPSPSKKAKMGPPASPKKAAAPAVVKVAPPAVSKSKKKPASSGDDSSSAETSAAGTSGKNGSRKRASPVKAVAPVESKKTKKQAAPPAPRKEPERPPAAPEEFYRQHIYKGKVGKHRESYANLTAAKKQEIANQMKVAQKQYIIDFERYLKSLPKDEIKQYIKRVNQNKAGTTAIIATGQQLASRVEKMEQEEEEDEEEESGESGGSEEEEEDDD